MIRLLKLLTNGSLAFEEFYSNIPPYSILSHTWLADNNQELLYDDVRQGACAAKEGFKKVKFCLEQAAKDHVGYCWIDTCCINKTNLVELSEAIISMFRWYHQAHRCYVYLSDVSTGGPDEANHVFWEDDFRRSRWFTRGWTLQELLAPRTVDFFCEAGSWLGDRSALGSAIHEITGIPLRAIRGASMSEFDHDERISWVKNRRTKLPEDKAYCLLGIFNTTMPVLYGEGEERAFQRLLRELQDSTTTANETVDTHAAKRRKTDENANLPSEEQINAILDSLRFDQMDARQMNIKPAHAKTCQWMLKDSAYIQWLDAEKCHIHNGILWIKGKPGSGKSTMMKFLLVQAKKRSTKGSIILDSFFNARGATLEKTVSGAYRTLLWHLLRPMRRASIASVFKNFPSMLLKVVPHDLWTAEVLKQILIEAFRQVQHQRIVCFVDALDECDQNQIRDLIAFFGNVRQEVAAPPNQLQFCLASRHYPFITLKKGITLDLEHNEGHKADIADYLASELDVGSNGLSDQIRATLQNKASGVFMWIVIVVKMLNEEYERGRLRSLAQLEQIPDDLRGLFNDIVIRDNRHREDLVLCIQWILFAEEPLSPAEFHSAVRIGRESSKLDSDESSQSPVASNYQEIRRYILDASKGLAEITQTGQLRVQFIHESVRDYLLQGNGLRDLLPALTTNIEGQSHEQLKQCCIAHINAALRVCFKETLSNLVVHGPADLNSSRSKSPRLGVFNDDFHHRSSQDCTDLEEFQRNWDNETMQGDFPLLRYATQNVLRHADEAAQSGISQYDFLKTFSTRQWIFLSWKFRVLFDSEYDPSTSLVYILAERNAAHLIRSLSDEIDIFHVGKEQYGLPLFAALAVDSKAAVQAMLESYFSRLGQLEQVQPLISSIGAAKNGRGAFSRGFRFLRNTDARTQFREHASAELLMLGLETESWFTPSQQSMQQHVEQIVRELLYRDSFDQAWTLLKDKAGVLPIQLWIKSLQSMLFEYAMRSYGPIDHPARVEQLVNDDIVEFDRAALLLQAASLGSAATVRFLLSTESGRTGGTSFPEAELRRAFDQAVLWKNVDSAEQLLNGMIEINPEGVGIWIEEQPYPILRGFFEAAIGENSLFWVSYILETSARSALIRDPLLLLEAVTLRSEAIVKVLLDQGFDPDSRDDSNRLAFEVATNLQAWEIAQQLLENGADPRKVFSSEVPLSHTLYYVVRSGPVSMVSHFLDAVAQTTRLNTDPWNQSDLLSAATERISISRSAGSTPALSRQDFPYNWERLAHRLLDMGADPNAHSYKQLSPLQQAIESGSESLVRRLLTSGANANGNQNDFFWPPIVLASRQGNETMVRLLIAAGADVDPKHELKGIAIEAAERHGHNAVAQVLREAGAREPSRVNTAFMGW